MTQNILKTIAKIFAWGIFGYGIILFTIPASLFVIVNVVFRGQYEMGLAFTVPVIFLVLLFVSGRWGFMKNFSFFFGIMLIFLICGCVSLQFLSEEFRNMHAGEWWVYFIVLGLGLSVMIIGWIFGFLGRLGRERYGKKLLAKV